MRSGTRSVSALHNRFGARATSAMHSSDRVAGAVVGVTGVLALMWLLIPALASSPGWPRTRGTRFCGRARDRPDRARPAAGRRDTRPPRRRRDRSPRCSTRSRRPTPVRPRSTGCPPSSPTAWSNLGREGRGNRVRSRAGGQRLRRGAGHRRHERACRGGGAGHTDRDTTTSDQFDAEVIAFDPNRDLAVLRVAGLDAPPLERGEGHVDDVGALFGHPGGGPLRESAMRIAEQIVARGTEHRAHRGHPARRVRARRRHRTRRLRRAHRRSSRQRPRRPLRLRPQPPHHRLRIHQHRTQRSPGPAPLNLTPHPVTTGPCLSSEEATRSSPASARVTPSVTRDKQAKCGS